MAHLSDSIESARQEIVDCRACPLWRNANHAVFGEGPAHAPLMLVGEQPGDKEDLEAKPFVGPAGRILDQALAEANIERKKTYVTNAVKHFKFVRRGKIRLHQKPDPSEIKACNPWLVRERAIVRPKLIVAMGTTAVRGVFGKAMPIGKNRGHLIALDDGAKGLVTIHPSYVLRLQGDDKEREYRNFVADLSLAAKTITQWRKAG